MMRVYKDKNGNTKHIGCHSCCCGEDRTETKQDKNGLFYKECVYCGMKSESVENRIHVLFAWNSMMKKIFEDQHLVARCCRISRKKLFKENEEFWYECLNCGFRSEKSNFSMILKEWNREIGIIENIIDLLLK